LYASWLAMMAVHESGHVLAAWVGGGRVRGVILPFVGFSRTDVDPNPEPRLELWGGPLWGSVVPLAAWLLLRKKLPRMLAIQLGFFTGLCLVANGAYLGIGWTMRAGDAAELIKLHTPMWVLIATGAPMYVLGLFIWHTLGPVGAIFRSHRAS
jgi:hypothetical protein